MVTIVQDFLQLFVKSLDKIIAPVASTAGPGGRSVHIQSENGLIVQRDGHKTLESMRPQEPMDYNAKEVLLGISRRVAMTAGDGTTSATNIFVWIMRNLLESLGSIKSRRAYSNGIKKALDIALEHIKMRPKTKVDASDYDTLYAIALVAASGDEDVAKNMAKAVSQVGRYGLVSAVPDADEWEVTTQPGYILKSPMWDPNKIPRGGRSFRLENPRILLIRDIVTKTTELNTVLSSWKAEGCPPLIIVSSSIEGDPRATLLRAINAEGQPLPIHCLSAPKTDEGWTDLAAITGAKIIYAPYGNPIVNAKMDQAGKVVSASVSASETAFTHDHVALTESGLMDRLDSKTDEDRIARLTGAVATVGVPAHTMTSWANTNFRCEDAYFAMRNAIDTGIVPAGYRLPLEIGAKIHEASLGESGDVKTAMEDCAAAISAHYYQILGNMASMECFADDIVEQILASGPNMTLSLGDAIINAVSNGVIIDKKFLVDSRTIGLVEPVAVTEAVLSTAFTEAALYAEVENGIIYNQ